MAKMWRLCKLFDTFATEMTTQT